MSLPPAVSVAYPETVPSPVAAAERVVALDGLRGFALLGIVLINITAFSAAPRILRYHRAAF